MKKIGFALGVASALLFSHAASAQVVKDVRKVGYYECGTMFCNFLTPDGVVYGFEPVEDLAEKIFNGCANGNMCAITGDFSDEEGNERILSVKKLEDSGMPAGH